VKKLARLLCLAFFCVALSCHLDSWGWLWSSDVDDRWRDNQTMVTPAPPPIGGDFSFIVISDTHVEAGKDTQSVFNAIAAKLIPGDAFVLVCGDLVQDGARADFQSFQTESAALGLPIYMVPGNHDLYNNGWPNYRDVIGRSSMYTFTAGPMLRVIAIDSANGTLGMPQRQWLEGVLAARTEPYCVTFTHMEFLCDTIQEQQQWTDITETYSLMHLLETSGVNYHFQGHTHRRLERTINGTAYCTADEFIVSFIRVSVTAGGISHQYVY
jgi:3',5'-cyclic AMP phosphodiesterase CpdA